MKDLLTEPKVAVLVGEDDAEPARRGAGEGSTAAQNHLVFEEVPPKTQLLLERGLQQVLVGTKRWAGTALRQLRAQSPDLSRSTYLSEVSPDEHGSGSVQVWDVQTPQRSRHVAVSGF